MEGTVDPSHLVLTVVNVILNTVTLLFMAWLSKRYPNGRH